MNSNTRRVSHVVDANRYAKQVIAGNITACKWGKLACSRHINDLARAEANPSWGFTFNPAAAERACKFIELLPHVKGKWAKKKKRVDGVLTLMDTRIKLEPWQKFIVCIIFGWMVTATSTRRFRTAYIEVARKNAKSTLAAGIALYMLALDGEEGAEIYSAATKREQAKIVFGVARSMARMTPTFRDRYGVQVQVSDIKVPATHSIFKPLDSEGSTQDGLNIHLGIIDELHAHKTRTLFDVLETGCGSREQSLLLLITTAGSNRAGICYEQRIYVTKVLQKVFEDETYFGIIYTINENDDWTDPEVWKKANPNLDVSASKDDVARLCVKAQQMASARNNFLTKRLNVWCNADSAWMNMDEWDACGDLDLNEDDFEGEDCIVSMDLASKVDIASKGKLFVRPGPGKKGSIVDHYYWFADHYLPSAAVEDGRNSQYEGWEQDGYLIATEGNVTDYDEIENTILDDADRYNLKEVAYDPHQATQMVNHLSSAEIECVEMRPTVLNFSEPMKELEALVKDKRFHHTGCPVMTWMVSNVVCHRDQKDNIYPRKEREENKIDGVVAAIMALGRAIAPDDAAGPSVYEQEDVVI